MLKRFLKHIALFLIPALAVILVVLWIDIFEIFGYKPEKYNNNPVCLNREMICTKTYLRYRKEEGFNSFILGNSKSLAFRCQQWQKHLPANCSAFHYDASGEGIIGISDKIKFIDSLGDSINQALIILDRHILQKTNYEISTPFIPHPSYSKISNCEYILTHLKASINIKFLFALSHYKLSNIYYPYMGSYINNPTHADIIINKHCDVESTNDKRIQNDSLSYYNKKIEEGVFFDRPISKMDSYPISNLEIELLQSIKGIFDKHNTNYKIVFSPVYDQIKVEEDQLKLIMSIFGKENTFNYSGINDFTNKIGNYYESSHYKPSVANRILDQIYSD